MHAQLKCLSMAGSMPVHHKQITKVLFELCSSKAGFWPGNLNVDDNPAVLNVNVGLW